MRATFTCAQFSIFDDVLSSADFEKTWRYLQFARLVPINPGIEYSPWHISDGQPLQGQTVIVTHESPEPHGQSSDKGSAQLTYPTNTAVDCIIEKLLQLIPHLEEWVGKPENDWALFSVTPWIYPSGTGLSWHSDGARYTGAYIFYAHPEWDAQWGGELLVADESCKLSYSSHLDLPPLSREERMAYRFDKREMNQHLSQVGTGRFIMAKPNRLVVLAGGNPHKITKVDPSAGDRMRATLSGFFLRAETVRLLSKRHSVEAQFGAGRIDNAPS